ncbi:MAG: HD domain-containing protein [Anaerolineae bacterium]|nr:HD domain-containing protein [Anaerolineae bacterium]
MADLSIYAGRWIALTENDTVAGVGITLEDARLAGNRTHPKDRLRLLWVSPHPPHIAVPDWPLHAIRTLLPADTWLVGGPVRDLLLARTPHDWDFATTKQAMALARTVANHLDAAYYPLDVERDTGRAVVRHPVTRHPITLDFAALRGDTIEADLQLRDFTINAMALNLEGRLIDPTHGQHDLQAHLIRTTNTHAFEDDPLRLLRAVRLANSLNFRIENRTAAAIQAQAKTIHSVASERIQIELLSLLQSSDATRGIELLDKTGLAQHTLPEVHALQAVEQSWPHYCSDAWAHTMAALATFETIQEQLRGNPIPAHAQRYVSIPTWAWSMLNTLLIPFQTALLDYLRTPISSEIKREDMVKWGTLFHDTGKATTSTRDEQGLIHFYTHPEVGAVLTRARLEQLHFPTKAVEFACTLVKSHMRLIELRKNPPGRRAAYRFYRDTGDAGVGVVLLVLADTAAVWGAKLEREHWRALLHAAQILLQAYFERNAEVVTPQPLLNGHDLMTLGIPQGPSIGQLLEALREAQAVGEVENREAAEAFVRQWQQNQNDA